MVNKNNKILMFYILLKKKENKRKKLIRTKLTFSSYKGIKNWAETDSISMMCPKTELFFRRIGRSRPVLIGSSPDPQVQGKKCPPLPRSIRSWLEFKSTFLKRFAMSKEWEAPIQCLRDIRQQPRKTMKSFLSHFIDEMTYYVQVTDREALSVLWGGPNMNTLFWRDV